MRIFDVLERKVLFVVSDHRHFVQGVAWDPLYQFIASQSSDRSVNIYSFEKNSKTAPKAIAKHSKISQPIIDPNSKEEKIKAVRIYEDEDINSFFRRLAFCPDGSFLATTAGLPFTGTPDHTSYLYSRSIQKYCLTNK